MKKLLILSLSIIFISCKKEQSKERGEPCGYITSYTDSTVVVNGVTVKINNTPTGYSVYGNGDWFCR